MLWVPLRRGVLDATLYDSVCQWLAADQCFSLCNRVSSTNKIDRHYIYNWNIVENSGNPHNHNSFHLEHIPTTIGNEVVVNIVIRRVWRYQRSNQNPYIEQGQTTQWPKANLKKDKQRIKEEYINVTTTTQQKSI